MAQLRFKNFSDLSFIQSIDKPKFLGPLLGEHKDYFERQKLDVTTLTNDDACDRRLLSVFTKPDEKMPPALLETLFALDDLADESGHDRILAEADRQGVDINGLGHDLTPGEFAIAVRGAHPALVRVCHEKTFFRKIKNYQEYQSKNGKKLTLAAVKKKLATLENTLAPWFESKNRSRACEIYAYAEGGDIKFQITHGRPVRTDGSIEKTLQRSRVVYRPQKHDSVIYDKATGVLKINAQTMGEKDLYRETIGAVLFGDADNFPAGDLYTLAPLSKGKAALATVDGVESVRLTEVWIQLDDNQRFVQISRAYNLIESIEEHGKPNLAEGNVVRASFLIKYSSGGRARKLEIRPTNVAIYDRDRDGEPAEAFMRANGFLKV
ncbi:MAG TPA: hypothetical protein ENK57_24610 [Polyangiaceae bacterium]|nr:hypothetical protein [Polyangiaceae bacterium]